MLPNNAKLRNLCETKLLDAITLLEQLDTDVTDDLREDKLKKEFPKRERLFLCQIYLSWLFDAGLICINGRPKTWLGQVKYLVHWRGHEDTTWESPRTWMTIGSLMWSMKRINSRYPAIQVFLTNFLVSRSVGWFSRWSGLVLDHSERAENSWEWTQGSQNIWRYFLNFSSLLISCSQKLSTKSCSCITSSIRISCTEGCCFSQGISTWRKTSSCRWGTWLGNGTRRRICQTLLLYPHRWNQHGLSFWHLGPHCWIFWHPSHSNSPNRYKSLFFPLFLIISSLYPSQ